MVEIKEITIGDNFLFFVFKGLVYFERVCFEGFPIVLAYLRHVKYFIAKLIDSQIRYF